MHDFLHNQCKVYRAFFLVTLSSVRYLYKNKRSILCLEKKNAALITNMHACNISKDIKNRFSWDIELIILDYAKTHHLWSIDWIYDEW